MAPTVSPASVFCTARLSSSYLCLLSWRVGRHPPWPDKLSTWIPRWDGHSCLSLELVAIKRLQRVTPIVASLLVGKSCNSRGKTKQDKNTQCFKRQSLQHLVRPWIQVGPHAPSRRNWPRLELTSNHREGSWTLPGSQQPPPGTARRRTRGFAAYVPEFS